MRYCGYGVIYHEICNHQIFRLECIYLIKSSTKKYFSFGVIYHEFCSHEILRLWCIISYNLQPRDIGFWALIYKYDIYKFKLIHSVDTMYPRFWESETQFEFLQFPSVSDQLFVHFGVRTILARLRIRSAASHWVQSEVFVCLQSLKLDLLLSILLTKPVANFCLGGEIDKVMVAGDDEVLIL